MTHDDRPCEKYTHCVRCGPHGDDHLFDHSLPGGAWFVDPSTGKSPLDEARDAEKRT